MISIQKKFKNYKLKKQINIYLTREYYL